MAYRARTILILCILKNWPFISSHNIYLNNLKKCEPQTYFTETGNCNSKLFSLKKTTPHTFPRELQLENIL